MFEVLAHAAFLCLTPQAIDGDTLRCADGRRVRLVAIDAREIDGTCNDVQACPSATYTDARRELARQVEGRAVSCTATGTSWQRTVARCTVEGSDLSCTMVRSGTAAEWRKYGRACL